jgi:hypothetical protein
VLPLDYRETAKEIRGTLQGIQEAAGDAFDMSAPLSAIERFASAAERVAAAAEPLAGLSGRGSRKQREAAAALNDGLMRMGRALVPINYTAAGLFGHDAALPVPAIPLLQPATRLRSLRQDSDEYLALLTQLVRNRNHVTYAIDTATEAAERAVT